MEFQPNWCSYGHGGAGVQCPRLAMRSVRGDSARLAVHCIFCAALHGSARLCAALHGSAHCWVTARHCAAELSSARIGKKLPKALGPICVAVSRVLVIGEFEGSMVSHGTARQRSCVSRRGTALLGMAHLGTALLGSFAWLRYSFLLHYPGPSFTGPRGTSLSYK